MSLANTLRRYSTLRQLYPVHRITQNEATRRFIFIRNMMTFTLKDHKIPVTLPDGLDEPQVLSFYPFNVSSLDQVIFGYIIPGNDQATEFSAVLGSEPQTIP